MGERRTATPPERAAMTRAMLAVLARDDRGATAAVGRLDGDALEALFTACHTLADAAKAESRRRWVMEDPAAIPRAGDALTRAITDGHMEWTYRLIELVGGWPETDEQVRERVGLLLTAAAVLIGSAFPPEHIEAQAGHWGRVLDSVASRCAEAFAGRGGGGA